MIKIHNRRFGYNRAGGGDLPLKVLYLQYLKYVCLWIIFSANLVWGEDPTKKVFDCATETCRTNKGESKIFETSIYFSNVNIKFWLKTT